MSGVRQAHPRYLASFPDDGRSTPEAASSNRFALTFAPGPSQTFQTPPGHRRERSGTSSSSDGESDHSEREPSSSNECHSQDDVSSDCDVAVNQSLSTPQPLSLTSAEGGPDGPRLSRTFSVPLPSQPECLRNPRRVPRRFLQGVEMYPQATPSAALSRFQELSLELADSVQMVVQTLLQISPAQILEPAKEQYAACSLLVPTTCMSAVLTTMKNLNFVSANMSDLFVNAGSSPPVENVHPPPAPKTPIAVSNFDIGEMLQGVGDALSGCAAEAGVDLVLFHADVGLRHVAVRGEEFAFSTTLTHVIRQVIETARRGDSVDVGLSIRSSSDESPDSPTAEESSERPGDRSPTALVDDGHVVCVFEIAHHFGESGVADETSTPTSPDASLPIRPKPGFASPLLQRLFLRTGAFFTCGLPRRNNLPGRVCELTFRLECGSLSAINARATPISDSAWPLLSGTRIAKEPTLEELTQFSEGLRGKKATLYASATSSFAHHLTSYLTAWGLDVSHVSSEQEGESCFSPGETTSSQPESGQVVNGRHPKPKARQWSMTEGYNPQENPSTPNGGARNSSMSFVFIDDDVSVLREQIQKFRAEQQLLPLNTYSRKRPSLAANHRPKSSSQVARAMGYGPSSTAPSSVNSVVVHFTSLTNYKLVRDTIQCDLAAHAATFQPPLEVMIIPKPAGPRRFLTALHTALIKPLVDPFFAPIATSPLSPVVHGSPFFSHVQQPSPKSPLARPWGSTRSASDRSARSPREGDAHVLHPPSPLSIADTAEYFPDSAGKLGTAPASGLVISSADGQPTGIVFNPRAKNKVQNPIGSVEDKGSKLQFLAPNPERLRTPAMLRSLHTEETSPAQFPLPFAALHSASHPQQEDVPSPAHTPTQTPISAEGKVRKPSVLADDVMPSTAPSGLPQRGSPVEARKVPSQPASPHAVESPTSWFAKRKAKRAAQNQKLTMEGAAINKSGKHATETTIVPPISVLIVDDNAINRTILSTFMKRKKVKYDVAKNGEEAVEKWRSGNFQLILMDIQMPVMDGIEATKEIRHLESLKAACAPVTPQSDSSALALTASSLESDRVAALAAGCNDFLTKPVSLRWLNNKIIEWGAIKALQMWADMPSEDERALSTEQSAQAQAIARRLHVPDGRATPVDDALSQSSSKARPEGPDAASSSTIPPPPSERIIPKQDNSIPRAVGEDVQQQEAKATYTVPTVETPTSSDEAGKSSIIERKEGASSARSLLPEANTLESAASESSSSFASASDGAPELEAPPGTP